MCSLNLVYLSEGLGIAVKKVLIQFALLLLVVKSRYRFCLKILAKYLVYHCINCN